MFTNIQRILIPGLCLGAMLAIFPVSVKAEGFSEQQNSGVKASTAGDLKGSGSSNAGVGQHPHSSPFILSSQIQPAAPLDVVRIGRLELIRKSGYKPGANGRVPEPFDRMEPVRALGVLSKPAFTVSFDLK